MNALKHGLDAQMLILPGEDEAAFQARLDAWKASLPPRNALEESLIEQAARDSWRLDRADRILAAHLSERIRLAQDEETRKRQAEAEAAEAAEIGRRLLDGPPAPTFDLDRIRDRMEQLAASAFWGPYTPAVDVSRIAGKRLSMPMHPDDPEHPARLLRCLESTAAGCRWLMECWSDLRAALDGGPGWSPDERLRAVRLLGKEPADAVDDPLVRTIYLCTFVLDPAGPAVFGDQVHESTNREFEQFLRRLEGRRAAEWVPASREEARRGLLALVEAIVAGLEVRSDEHRARAAADADSAATRMAIDTSPAGQRLHRLQCRLHNTFLRTIELLMKVRSRPEPPSSGATLESQGACEEMRNEADDARPAVADLGPSVSDAATSPEEPPIAAREPVSGPSSCAEQAACNDSAVEAPPPIIGTIEPDVGRLPHRGHAEGDSPRGPGFRVPGTGSGEAGPSPIPARDPGRSMAKARRRRRSAARPPPC